MFLFLAIGLALLLGAMIPGPDFFVVAKNTMLHSRRAGAWTALGVGSAVIVHATYSIAGLGYLLAHSQLMFSVIKWLGALYLAYLGLRLLGASHTPVLTEVPAMLRQNSLPSSQPFIEGFGTNLLNPKAIMFFVGIFSQAIHPEVSIQTKLAFVFEAAFIVSAWFLMVVFFLDIPRVRAAMNRSQSSLAKMMGVVLIGFAIKLFLQQAS